MKKRVRRNGARVIRIPAGSVLLSLDAFHGFEKRNQRKTDYVIGGLLLDTRLPSPKTQSCKRQLGPGLKPGPSIG